MVATTPDQVIELFTAYFNSGDLEGLSSLYEPRALFIPDPGAEAVSGIAAVRESLQGYIAMGGVLTVLASTAVSSGDIALTHSRWRLESSGANAIEVVSAEVVRRQPDGHWRYAIDNPWGAEELDSRGH
jgi:ketosteroid isomerase-like protein